MYNSASSRSGHPVWNEVFRAEIADDSDLQNFPLKLEACDAEGGSIGVSDVDLGALLASGRGTLQGWLPLYHTFKGMQGSLYGCVRIDLVEEMNPYTHAALGVAFYSISAPPLNFHTKEIMGLTDALTVVSDPEYDWKDLIRSSRYSNETRRNVIQTAAMGVRRAVGKKARQSGANAVVGYRECVDLEGDVTDRICVRGFGTAVYLEPLSSQQHQAPKGSTPGSSSRFRRSSSASSEIESPQQAWTQQQQSNTLVHTNRWYRSSALLSPSLSPVCCAPGDAPRPDMDGALRMGEGRRLESSQRVKQPVRIVTLRRLPLHMTVQFGTVVAARSVKLLSARLSQGERSLWWQELRDELQCHADALGCDCVLGYSENVTMNHDVCLLSATGTAVVLLSMPRLPLLAPRPNSVGLGSPPGVGADDPFYLWSSNSSLPSSPTSAIPAIVANGGATGGLVCESGMEGATSVRQSGSSSRVSPLSPSYATEEPRLRPCFSAHMPDPKSNHPFVPTTCSLCQEGTVPPFLLATTECPEGLPITGRGRLVEARVCRLLHKSSGELHATEASECLPFLELSLHRQLLLKLRLAACNAAFGLQVEISLGDHAVLAFASATGVLLPCLPPPELVLIRCAEPALPAQPAPSWSVSSPDGSARAWRRWAARARRWFRRSVRGRRRAETASVSCAVPDEDAYAALERRSCARLQARQKEATILTTAFDWPYGCPGSLSSAGADASIPCLALPPAFGTPSVPLGVCPTEESPLCIRTVRNAGTIGGTGGAQVFEIELDDEVDREELREVAADREPGADLAMGTVDCLPGALFALTSICGRPSTAEIMGSYFVLYYCGARGRCMEEEVMCREYLFESYQLNGRRRGAARSGDEEGSDTDEDIEEVSTPLPAPFVYAIRRIELNDPTSAAAITRQVTQVCDEMYCGLLFRLFVRGVYPVFLGAMQWRVALLGDDAVELVLTAHGLRMHSALTIRRKGQEGVGEERRIGGNYCEDKEGRGGPEEVREQVEQYLMPPLRKFGLLWNEEHSRWRRWGGRNVRKSDDHMSITSQQNIQQGTELKKENEDPSSPKDPLQFSVLVSPLSSLPNTNVENYLGLVSLHVIKETTTLKNFGAFYNEFLMDALGIARARVKAVGGNALLGFRINNILMKEDKNQAYAVLSICGDAALIRGSSGSQATCRSS